MSSSTARRTTVARGVVALGGAGALGLVLVAGPASAAPVGAQVPVPLPTASPLDVLLEAADPVVSQLPAPVQSPVREAVDTVQGAVPAVPAVPVPPAPVPLPVPAPTTPPSPPAPAPEPEPEAPTSAAPPAQQPPAAAQPPAGSPPAAAPPQDSAPVFSDARTLRAFSAGSGTAVLDAFNAAIGMRSTGGFGSASALRFDAMAPEIAAPFATLPGVEAPEVAPREIELAAGLPAPDPVVPGALPGLTVAAAALAIAAAAAAHLAAAARRRDLFG